MRRGVQAGANRETAPKKDRCSSVKLLGKANMLSSRRGPEVALGHIHLVLTSLLSIIFRQTSPRSPFSGESFEQTSHPWFEQAGVALAEAQIWAPFWQIQFSKHSEREYGFSTNKTETLITHNTSFHTQVEQHVEVQPGRRRQALYRE